MEMALYKVDLPGHRKAHKVYHQLKGTPCNHDCMYYEENEPGDPKEFIEQGKRGPDDPETASDAERRSESLLRAIDQGISWSEGDEDIR